MFRSAPSTPGLQLIRQGGAVELGWEPEKEVGRGGERAGGGRGKE